MFYSYNFKEILKYLKYEFLNCLMLIFFSHGIVILSMANIMQAKKFIDIDTWNIFTLAYVCKLEDVKKKFKKAWMFWF